MPTSANVSLPLAPTRVAPEDKRQKEPRSDWVDIEEKPRRRRKIRRTPEKQRKRDDQGRFLPRLSQILEGSEAKHTSRREEPRRVVQNDIQRHINASLLSVLSGLTTTTDKSSGSNSTITQRSYTSRRDGPSRAHRYRRSMSDVSFTPSSRVEYEYEDSEISSPASHRPSEVGSSNGPDTPSSRSTYPSPTFSRNSDDKQTTIEYHPNKSEVSAISTYTDGTYASSLNNGPYFYREPDMKLEGLHEDDQHLPAPMPAHPSAFSAQYLEDMHQSQSHSSNANRHDKALEQYTYKDITLQDAQDVMPPAPDAPSIGQRTLAGYEMLALELSTNTTIKPMYRKFEFLNHRILLHLQDELSDLEEQLRTADEIIAQMEPDSDGKRAPASRRQDAYYGADIHHHRTALLGRIFVKTEQYNKAMSSYSALTHDCTPAQSQDVLAYQTWLTKERPIHALETRFLSKAEDLVMPGQSRLAPRTSLSLVVLTCSIIIAVPSALFTLITTLHYRLLVVLLSVISAAALAILQKVSILDTLAWTISLTLVLSTIALYVPK